MNRFAKVCLGAGATALTASSGIAGYKLTKSSVRQDGRALGVATGLAVCGTVGLMIFATIATLWELD